MRQNIERKETKMNAQQLHHKSVPHELLCFVEPEDFTDMYLSTQTTHDDSVWEEFDEYAEESLPNHVLAFIKEAAWE